MARTVVYGGGTIEMFSKNACIVISCDQDDLTHMMIWGPFFDSDKAEAITHAKRWARQFFKGSGRVWSVHYPEEAAGYPVLGDKLTVISFGSDKKA